MLAAMSSNVELGNPRGAGAFATLDQLLVNKAGGTVINVAWTDRWIQDPGNIHNLGQAARLLSSKGLRVWLYDEYFYPSGWAKGLAVQGQPENQARNLAFITHKGSGAKQLSFRLPADGIRFEYAAFYPNNRTTDGSRAVPVPVQETSVAMQSPAGDWTLYVFYVQKHNVGHGHYHTYEKLPGGGRGYLNFLNRAAVARYLEVTLQPLSTGIAGFNGMFDGLFIDEPSLMSFYSSTTEGGAGFSAVPYGSELFPEFKKLHGYDLQPYLPCLFEGSDEGARTVRIQFYRTIASLMERNFMGQFANWCHTNGIRFSGHFLLEEFLTDQVGYYGDLMKVIARMEYPGCDVLSRLPATYLKDEYLGTRYVSSAARGAGRDRVMVEICPVRGDADVFSRNPFDGYMALMTHVFLHGADHLNLYGHGRVESEVDQQRMNSYSGRIAWLLRNSVHAAEVAVYNPIADVQAAMRPRSDRLPSLDPEASAKDSQVDQFCDRGPGAWRYRQRRTAGNRRPEIPGYHPAGTQGHPAGGAAEARRLSEERRRGSVHGPDAGHGHRDGGTCGCARPGAKAEPVRVPANPWKEPDHGDEGDRINHRRLRKQVRMRPQTAPEGIAGRRRAMRVRGIRLAVPARRQSTVLPDQLHRCRCRVYLQPPRAR